MYIFFRKSRYIVIPPRKPKYFTSQDKRYQNKEILLKTTVLLNLKLEIKKQDCFYFYIFILIIISNVQ